jgi:predicted alpha/beta superfamily hydrolase
MKKTRRPVPLSKRFVPGKVLTFNIDMPQLDVAGRRIWVYLPPGYDAGELRYPVLYMHDGQNLFDPETSFCGDWGVGESLDALYREKKTEGVIVVGIDNGGEERWNEYSPWGGPGGEGRGSGDKYARFIVDDLKPLVDKKFRTLPGREHTGIAGSSLGGTISFYISLKYPGVFSKAGLFSPSFWFARVEAVDLVKKARVKQDLRVYMDVGTEEGDRKEEYLEDARLMTCVFSDEKKIEQRFVVDEGGIHNEKAWARRFPAAFLWLFEGAGSFK